MATLLDSKKKETLSVRFLPSQEIHFLDPFGRFKLVEKLSMVEWSSGKFHPVSKWGPSPIEFVDSFFGFASLRRENFVYIRFLKYFAILKDQLAIRRWQA